MTQASAIPSPRAAQAADRTVYFAPKRSPLPPSWAGLQQRGRSRRVPCELRDLSLFLYKQGTVLQPALLLSPTQTLFLVRGDLLGTSPS